MVHFTRGENIRCKLVKLRNVRLPQVRTDFACLRSIPVLTPSRSLFIAGVYSAVSIQFEQLERQRLKTARKPNPAFRACLLHFRTKPSALS